MEKHILALESTGTSKLDDDDIEDKGLEMAIDWSYEQKIIPRRIKVDELFDDTTAHLDV